MPMLLSRLSHWFQTEDALLFGWLIVVEPLLGRVFGAAVGAAGRSGTLTPLSLGLSGFYVLAGLGAVACLLTRSPAAPPPEGGEPDVSTPAGYARLPMIVVLGILFDSAGRVVNLPFGDWLFALSLLAWAIAFMLPARLPLLPDFARRMLVSPAIIVTTSMFTGIMNGVFTGVDLRAALATYGTPEWQLVSAGACLFLVVSLVLYGLFVFAPRQVASAGGTWRQWLARFVLYMAGVALNLGPLKLFG